MYVHARLYPPSERDYGTVAEYLTTIHRHGPTVTPTDAVRFALKVTAALIIRLEKRREKRARQVSSGAASRTAGGAAEDGAMLARPAAGHAPTGLSDEPGPDDAVG